MRALRGLLGVYEKSLPVHEDWSATFESVASAGFEFFELSVDESAERMSRLDWPGRQRNAVRSAARAAGVQVGSIALSAHRGFPLGHIDAEVRARAIEIGVGAIDLAADLGASLVQVAGYFTFYGPRHRDARAYFLDGLMECAEHARKAERFLAIENVDGQDITSVQDALTLVRDGQLSDVVGLYVDVGNCVGNGLDPVGQLRSAASLTWAIQLKETRLGEFRRVRFGEGNVPWKRVFAQLNQQCYDGPLSIEMWNDDDDSNLASEALRYLRSVGLDR